jgi:hypothetical protein
LLDEWSAIPIDIQPYLAEFIRKGILPVTKIVIKIASLEYRSSFSLIEGRNRIGFELGSDIAVTQDLDDSYVYDRNPTRIMELYSNILYRHISLGLEPGYLKKRYKAAGGRTLIRKLFTDVKTFVELSRAAEGVIRDLINIFGLAYAIAQRNARSKIDKKSIIEAARQWFEQDKAQNLDQKLQYILSRIIHEVIGTRKARSFMLPRELEKHEIIQRLFDARVLHHVMRGYSDPDNSGIRYNVYNLDYGTYVDLIGTTRQPEIVFEPEKGEKEIVVPIDDKRSIRRIILKEETLQ